MVKKVLIVSWHFPPYKSSSAFNLFKRLKDTGYDYDVLQIKRADKPENEEMFLYSLSKFNRYEIEMPSEDSRNIEARKFFIKKVIEFYDKLKESNHYQVMISHSHEFASHIAAMRIKELNPKLRWVASFGDPIAANPYNESYKFPLLHEDSALEVQVLAKADRIIVTNSYQKDLVRSTQDQLLDENKFFVLPHCYDERMYPQQLAINSQDTEAHKFRFRHVGMLYKFKRTSEPFILGAQRLIEKHPELKDKFTIEFYGAKDRYIDSVSSYGLEEIVSFKGTVNYLDSLAVMSEADCLLLRDADFSDQGLNLTPFYPGKLADYFGAKKPILAVTMAAGCVPDMMSELGCISLTENSIEDIANAMHQAILGRLKIKGELIDQFSYRHVGKLARKALTFEEDKKRILIAGHDLKFAKFIIDAIEKNSSFEILIDKWQGHSKHDEEQSLELINKADIIFCEWGLGNLVWYSKHKKEGQKLITRIHAQELKTRHLDQCNHDNIDHYIFVSPYYFELMIAEFKLERKKCKMIFNMVDTALLNRPKRPDSKYHLGMIGDVPQTKRLDRALDIFEKLYKKNRRYKLYIKGKRPEEYPWMHSKAKADEMAYYQHQYDRIKANNWEDNVIFEGHGPIEEWLQNIGWILSVSDNESFHLAVAEGMASGAYPLILGWVGAEYIYSTKYIFTDYESIVQEIIHMKKNIGLQTKQEAAKFFRKSNKINQIIEVINYEK